jgi:serine/threonine protein phosphatase PrpC
MKLLKRLRVIAVLVVVISLLVYVVHPATLDAVVATISGWLAALLDALQSLLASVRPGIAGVTPTQLLLGAGAAWFVFVLALVLLARSGRPRQAVEDVQGPPSQRLPPAPAETSAPSHAFETQPHKASSSAPLPPLTALRGYDAPRSADSQLSSDLDASFVHTDERSVDALRMMPLAAPAAGLNGRQEPKYAEWPPPTATHGLGAVSAPHPEMPAAKYPTRDHVVALTGVAPAGSQLLPYGIFFIAEDAAAPHADGASSKRVLQLMVEQIVASLVDSRTLDGEQLAAFLDLAVIRASIDLRQQSIVGASTLEAHMAGVMIVDTRAYVVNVGECRAFVFRHGRVTPITPNHSVVLRVSQSDPLGPDAAYANHVNQRVGGVQGAIEVNALQVWMQAQDLLLLCSPGVARALRPEQIEAILRAAPSLTAPAHLLARAGDAETTAVIVRAVHSQMPQFGVASHPADRE